MAREFTTEELIRICVKARTLLWDGKGRRPESKEVYVCYALSSASVKLFSHWRPAALTSLVKQHIGDHTSLNGFLRTKLGDSKVNRMTNKQIQAWRFLMLDNMIKMLREGDKK